MSKPKSVYFSGINAEKVELRIFPSVDDEFDIDGDFIQLKEGRRYEYKLSNEEYRLQIKTDVISRSRTNPSSGLIEPGIFVGLLKLVLVSKDEREVSQTFIDVKSAKINYLTEYQTMLSDITDICTDLLMQLESPVEQSYNPEDTEDEATLVQRMYFLKSLVGSDDFKDSVQKVLSQPNTRWMEELREKPLSACTRMGRFEMRQLASAGRRQKVPDTHPLRTFGSIPEVILVKDKRDSLDTQENRFIKHALQVFQLTVEDINSKLKSLRKKDDSLRYPGLSDEVDELLNYFEEILSENLFKEVEQAQVLALSSPVLQNKEGYRQILRSWLQFDLAAKLSWSGGDDIYEGGKRDVATLYEYWGFFKLLDIVCELFELEKPLVESLIQESSNGLTLKLKQGKSLHIDGEYAKSGRNLKVKFSFNRTFSRARHYPAGGSWTKNMRPDYTLSLWPAEFNESDAEIQELISHIHFDAKYKVDFLKETFTKDEQSEEEIDVELAEEEKEEKQGTYKRADLLKMHAYRDAIRRTAGAYILYPGTDEEKSLRGFHEILPGLGAFPLRPETDDGSSKIKEFLKEIVAHVSNRASQFDRKSYHTYNIHKDRPENEIRELLPESDIYQIRSKPIVEQTVLVGWYKDETHLKWILKNKFYNCRTDTIRGSLKLNPDVTGADYLLLHSKGELGEMKKLYKLTGEGPRVFSSERLEKLGYTKPSQPYYLVFELEKSTLAFEEFSWDLTENEMFKGRSSAEPKAIKFSTLMQHLIKT